MSATPVPARATNSQKHEEVAIGYDPQGDEEHEAAQHEGVALVSWSRGDIVPCARRHEAFWDIGACSWKNKRTPSTSINRFISTCEVLK